MVDDENDGAMSAEWRTIALLQSLSAAATVAVAALVAAVAVAAAGWSESDILAVRTNIANDCTGV